MLHRGDGQTIMSWYCDSLTDLSIFFIIYSQQWRKRIPWTSTRNMGDQVQHCHYLSYIYFSKEISEEEHNLEYRNGPVKVKISIWLKLDFQREQCKKQMTATSFDSRYCKRFNQIPPQSERPIKTLTYCCQGDSNNKNVKLDVYFCPSKFKFRSSKNLHLKGAALLWTIWITATGPLIFC